jgi:hypothetical protein
MSVTVNGTNGLTFNDGSSQNTSPFTGGLGFRNRIINGDFRIDQRNAGASITPTGTQYSVDRWRIGASVASKISVQQSSVAPEGFTNSVLITSLSSYSVGSSEEITFGQRVEGFNCSDLGWGTANAQPVTLSFKVRSSLTGTFGGSLRNADVNRSYPFTYTISSANTWETKSITIAGDTSGTWLTNNGIGIVLFFGIGVGSTLSGTAGAWASANYVSATGATSVVGTNGATFYITGVQLEKGSTATSFDYRPYGTELALCQRYYYKNFPNAVSAAFGISGFASSTTSVVLTGRFPVSMRTSPTALEQSGTASDYRASGLAAANCSSVPTFSSASFDGFNVSFFVASGLTAGQAYLGNAGSSTGANAYLAWSAEL